MAKEFNGKLRISYSPAAPTPSTSTSCLPAASGPSPWPPPCSSPAATSGSPRSADKLDALDFKPFTGVDVAAWRPWPGRPVRQVPREGHQAPAPPQTVQEGAPAWTASPPPARAAAPSSRTSPRISSCAGRAKYASALRLITEKNPCPSSPAPSAPTTA